MERCAAMDSMRKTVSCALVVTVVLVIAVGANYDDDDYDNTMTYITLYKVRVDYLVIHKNVEWFTMLVPANHDVLKMRPLNDCCVLIKNLRQIPIIDDKSKTTLIDRWTIRLLITSRTADTRCHANASSSMPFPHDKFHSTTNIMHTTLYTCKYIHSILWGQHQY